MLGPGEKGRGSEHLEVPNSSEQCTKPPGLQHHVTLEANNYRVKLEVG